MNSVFFDADVEDDVRILAELKPRFIHHERSKELMQAMLEDFGCDGEKNKGSRQ